MHDQPVSHPSRRGALKAELGLKGLALQVGVVVVDLVVVPHQQPGRGGVGGLQQRDGRLAADDLPAVQKLKSALDAAGITTWFDMDRLESGDDYDHKIRANIGRCSFFLPVISGSTQRRLEAYFRREWSYAVDRARNRRGIHGAAPARERYNPRRSFPADCLPCACPASRCPRPRKLRPMPPWSAIS